MITGAESILTFALGFLIASLIALALAAPMWRRAEKVARKRLETALPISVEDVAADKDKLRADFALSTRKLELNLERLRKKAQGQMTSVQARNNKMIELETNLKEESASNSSHETEITTLSEKLARTEADLKQRTAQMEEMKSKLGELQTVLNRQAGAIKEAASLAEGHRDEIDSLKGETDEKTAEITEQADKITKQAQAISTRDTKLAECGERVSAQRLRLADKNARLKENAAVIQALKAELGINSESLSATQSRISELEIKEAQLGAANEEIEALKTQLNGMAEEYRTRQAADNYENAALRQRLGDLAADVARLTDEMDGGEEVDRLLAKPASVATGLLRSKNPARSEKPILSESLAPSKDTNGGAGATLKKALPINALTPGDKDLAHPYPGTGEAAMVQRSTSLADRIRNLQRGLVK